ncbi:MAG TPA: SDR family NAD(P)-dependent oxidoreductase, partial [Terriglobales bacterium]|nr:SDR family NAD(P)-dependent oxidoreductase [Terriglobales bacterium]
MRLEGKVALITGGTSGIGEATALLFAQEGARVAITGRNRERGHSVVREIKGAGGQAIFTQCDVRSAEQCRDAVNQTLQAFNRLDILFNNAGVYYPHTALDCTEEEWDLQIDINLKGT